MTANRRSMKSAIRQVDSRVTGRMAEIHSITVAGTSILPIQKIEDVNI